MTTTTFSRNGTETRSSRFDFLTRVSARVGNYIARSRAERQLEQLDDRLLLDIGVKRAEINHMVWGR